MDDLITGIAVNVFNRLRPSGVSIWVDLAYLMNGEAEDDAVSNLEVVAHTFTDYIILVRIDSCGVDTRTEYRSSVTQISLLHWRGDQTRGEDERQWITPPPNPCVHIYPCFEIENLLSYHSIS